MAATATKANILRNTVRYDHGVGTVQTYVPYWGRLEPSRLRGLLHLVSGTLVTLATRGWCSCKDSMIRLAWMSAPQTLRTLRRGLILEQRRVGHGGKSSTFKAYRTLAHAAKQRSSLRGL